MDFQIAIASQSFDADNIIINDITPYSSVTTDGEQKADFANFYKVKIESSGYVYTFSSAGDGDASITTPAASVDPAADIELPYVLDGAYDITIMAVPTWDAAVTYTTGKHVYRSGVLYIALQEATNKDPVTEATYWDEVDEDDLTSVYKVTTTVVVTYNTREGFEYFALKACEDNLLNIGANFLENYDWEKAARLDNMLSVIAIYESGADYDVCDHIIAAAKVITDTIPD